MSEPGFSPIAAVRALYEAHPYPPVGYLSPFLQRVRPDELPTLNYRAAYSASFGSTSLAAGRPRILVAGCGTLEASVVALANPRAEILALDLSAATLRRARWQARLRGLGSRIRFVQGDLERLPEEEGPFDLIVATGVIHHLPDPALGFLSLRERLAPRGVMRVMVYSYWGRALLYATKELAQLMGADSPARLRALVQSLPADHPYKIYFHLYSDTATDAGLSDGYLHPCDQPFSASSLGSALEGAGLRVGAFLHGPEGQPGGADPWAQLQALEALGELEENFRFFAHRAEDGPAGEAAGWEWNEALPRRGKLRSRLLGRELAFDRGRDPSGLAPAEVAELRRALFLLPGGTV